MATEVVWPCCETTKTLRLCTTVKTSGSVIVAVGRVEVEVEVAFPVGDAVVLVLSVPLPEVTPVMVVVTFTLAVEVGLSAGRVVTGGTPPLAVGGLVAVTDIDTEAVDVTDTSVPFPPPTVVFNVEEVTTEAVTLLIPV